MKNIKYLMKMTIEFIDGKMDGTTYMLDFPYEQTTPRQRMKRKSRTGRLVSYD